MTAIIPPQDWEIWAQAEVDAGRAQSVEEIAGRALRGYRIALEDFRRSLDEAEREADELGWLDAEEVFARLEAELEAEIAAEDAHAQVSM